LRSLCASICPRLHSMRWASCCLLISSEKTAHGSIVGGDVLDDVHRERGLSHARPRRDDDHLAVLQAVEHVVELEEAGLEPRWPRFSIISKTSCSDVSMRHHRPPTFFWAMSKIFLLRLVEHQVGLLVRGVGVAEDVVAGGDELAQQRLLADDAGVVRAVRGDGTDVEDLREVLGPPISSSSCRLISSSRRMTRRSGGSARRA
jgi:hypothetical protein